MIAVWALKSFFSLSLFFQAGWVRSQAVTIKKHFHIIFESWLPFQVCLSFSLIWLFSSEYSTSHLEAVLLRDFRGPVKFLKSLLLVNLLPIFSAHPCDPIQWSGSPIPRLNKLLFSSCACSGGHTLSRLGLFTDIDSLHSENHCNGQNIQSVALWRDLCPRHFEVTALSLLSGQCPDSNNICTIASSAMQMEKSNERLLFLSMECSDWAAFGDKIREEDLLGSLQNSDELKKRERRKCPVLATCETLSNGGHICQRLLLTLVHAFLDW